MLILNTSIKLHFKIAVFVGLWLVVFLILIAPFDVAELPFTIRLQILPPYGVISLLGYLAIIPVQNWVFAKIKQWNVFTEITVLLLFNLLVLLGSFLYYKSSIINGEYSFTQFTGQVYYPIFFLLLPIILFGRWFLTKRTMTPNKDEVLLTGENRYDFLKIKAKDLVCISSADNYIEVAYLSNSQLQRKLLRGTLKKVENAHKDLLRVHRSHLVNPAHIREWKDAKTLKLTQTLVPVSKKYKQDIMVGKVSSLKEEHSSQSL